MRPFHAVPLALLAACTAAKLPEVRGEGGPRFPPVQALDLTAPTVAVSGPATPIAPGASFKITATASDPNGVVLRVKIYENGLQVDDDATYPFDVTLSGRAQGQYSYTATAFDSEGKSTTSEVYLLQIGEAGEAPPAPSVPAIASLINEARASGRWCDGKWYPSAPPLAYSLKLEEAARGHSLDMAGLGYFAHVAPDGRTPAERIASVGYTASAWGENLAAGYATAAEAVSGFFSGKHCSNLMAEAFSEVGVGYAERLGSYYVRYWTVNLATPGAQ